MLEPGSLRIILVGCGNMGGAMLEGWLKSALCESVSVINPSRPDILDRYPDAPLHYYSEPEDMPDESYQNADIIILAVKPNKMQQACSALSEKISNNTAVISVAAGITLSSLKQWAGGISAIIRVMPNTPCAIGRGIAVGVSSDSVTDTQKEAATSLMQACGHFEWTEKEETLDAVTALSGSGPAYIFYMI